MLRGWVIHTIPSGYATDVTGIIIRYIFNSINSKKKQNNHILQRLFQLNTSINLTIIYLVL